MILTATAGSESDVEIKVDYITVSAPYEPVLVTRTIIYTYDPLYRLTEADYRSTELTTGSSGENFQYAYDAAGNRTIYTATVGSTQVTTYILRQAQDRLTTPRTGLSRLMTWPILGMRRGMY